MKKIFSTIVLAVLLTACNSSFNDDFANKKTETRCKCPCEHCKDCDCKECNCEECNHKK